MTVDPVLDHALSAYINSLAKPARAGEIRILKAGHSPNGQLTRLIAQVDIWQNGDRHRLVAKYLRETKSAKLERELLQIAAKANPQNSIVSVVPILFSSNNVMLMPLIPGEDLQTIVSQNRRLGYLRSPKTRDRLESCLFALGVWLAAFHATEESLEVQEQRDAAEAIAKQLEQRLVDHLENHVGFHLPSALETKVKAVIPQFRNVATLRSTFGMVHGDFCPENIMCLSASQQSFVLDFEHGGQDFQISDVSRFCAKLQLNGLHIGASWRLLNNLEAQFLKGYRVGKQFDEGTLKLYRFVDILRVRRPLLLDKKASRFRKSIILSRRKKYKRLVRRELSDLHHWIANQR